MFMCTWAHYSCVCMYSDLCECGRMSPSRIKTCEPDARLRLRGRRDLDLEAAYTYIAKYRETAPGSPVSVTCIRRVPFRCCHRAIGLRGSLC